MLFKRFNFSSVSLLDLLIVQRKIGFTVSKLEFLGFLCFNFNLPTLFDSNFFFQKQLNSFFINNPFTTKYLSFTLLNLFSVISSLQLSANCGFFAFLQLNGVGFRLFLNTIDSILKIEFGASHALFLLIPKKVLVFARGSFIFVFSMFKSIFLKFMFLLKFLKKKDPYKGKGFLFEFEVPNTKKGKIRN